MEPEFTSPGAQASSLHVHVYSADGEAKFWLEPEIELARNYGLSPHDLRIAKKLIEEHKNEIKNVWLGYFGR